MRLEAERRLVVEYGRKLLAANLTTGSGGNLSIYNRAEGLIAIKPSGIAYPDIQPEDVVVVKPDGSIVDGELKPSSEMSIHLALMRYRPDINAVIHTHSVYATTFACLNWEIPAVHYLMAYSGKKVPLAAYATFGTPELAANIVSAIRGYNACLMANHGVVAVGPNIARAFAVAEEIELVARIYYQTMCIGKPVVLSDQEMGTLCEKFMTYGLPAGKN